ncbi:hypothetical protein WMY93_024991 [Mugilogobius chulae]|uniref:Uncharacterized protein n=1 Tax=Mugilogobius chulae TaxID=88201 RepID=A0AAW0NDP2_9GOBI
MHPESNGSHVQAKTRPELSAGSGPRAQATPTGRPELLQIWETQGRHQMSAFCSAVGVRGPDPGGHAERRPEDLSLVLGHIHSRLVEVYFRSRRTQSALEHAHRATLNLYHYQAFLNLHVIGWSENEVPRGNSTQKPAIFLLCHRAEYPDDPSHFQNHLRQAVVYRALNWPWLAAKSALTADWLYCSQPAPERRISSQLRLYWQAMLNEAQQVSSVTVLYTPFTGEPSAEELSQTELKLKEQDPSVVYVYTDPRGLHILPQTTDWLSAAPEDVQRYYISLGFKLKKDGLFIERLCSRLWPTLAEARGDRSHMQFKGHQQQKVLNPEELKDMYEKILPVLDMMQATQLNTHTRHGYRLTFLQTIPSVLLLLAHLFCSAPSPASCGTVKVGERVSYKPKLSSCNGTDRPLLVLRPPLLFCLYRTKTNNTAFKPCSNQSNRGESGRAAPPRARRGTSVLDNV